jgi:hypothetical protein
MGCCFPLPRIDETLDTLAGAKWLSTHDLKIGYWQVYLHLDDKEKTVLDVSKGLAVHSHALWSLECSSDV